MYIFLDWKKKKNLYKIFHSIFYLLSPDNKNKTKEIDRNKF